MDIILLVTNAGLIVSSVVLYKLWASSKSNFNLMRELNQKLREDVTELTTRNSNLWFELQHEKENNIFEEGTLVAWKDKQGETNKGSVLDDYKIHDKVYVVVMRMKDGKPQGAPISIPFTKLTVL